MRKTRILGQGLEVSAIGLGCCLLYTSLYMYRMAVYYASSKNPDPKKLKWWIWKD